MLSCGQIWRGSEPAKSGAYSAATSELWQGREAAKARSFLEGVQGREHAAGRNSGLTNMIKIS